MTNNQRQGIIRRWKAFPYRKGAASMIAAEMGMATHRVKSVIENYQNQITRDKVRYRVFKRRADGLRLVRVKVGESKMDWWTDRDDEGIERHVQGIRDRMSGEVT